jgi:hypothetical protein
MGLLDSTIPMIPGLPPTPQSPAEYHEWAERIIEHRVEMAYLGGISEEIRAREAIRCSKSFLYCATTYGFIFEARGDADWEDEEWDEDWDGFDDEDEELESEPQAGGIIPFIPYPFQIELSYWIDQRMRSKGPTADGAVIKARDMGVSNVFAFWTAHKWLFRNPFQARLLSRNERLVDRTGDPDSLFWKIDTFLMSLPDYIFDYGAPGFSWKQHRLMMRLINPSNGNLISGESTQADAGRGGRATVALLDEGPFMDDFGDIWSALRGSTKHRFMVGTPSTRKGFDAYNLVHGEEGYTQPAVLKIEWSEHPDHDLEWFEMEAKRDHPQKFAREVLMDWHAGAGEWVYPETHTMEPGHYPYIPHAGDLVCVIDDGGDDYFAIGIGQYIESTGRFRILKSYQNSHQPTDFYGELLTAKPSARFHWGREERDFIEWLKNKPPMTFYGDAHGAHIEQIANMSVYEHLFNKYGIIVNYYIGPDSGTRLTFQQRRLKMGELLTFTDFDDDPSAQFVLTAFKRHKFREDEEHRLLSNESRQPIHNNKFSHIVSAFEYFAVQWELFRQTTAKGRGGVQYTGSRRRGKHGSTAITDSTSTYIAY